MRVRHHRPLVLATLLSLGALVGMRCGGPPTVLTVESPVHGSFSTDASVVVSGTADTGDVANALLTVNGAPVVVEPDGTWATSVPLDFDEVFNPFLVQLVNLANGREVRERVVVIAGDSVADGGFSPSSLALRLNDSGLDSVQPLVSSFVDLDLADLLPPGTEVISNFCAIDGGFLGCLGRVDVVIANPPPSFAGFGLDVDSMAGFVAGDVSVQNVRVDAQIEGSGAAPSCGLRITADQVNVLGDFALAPDAVDPALVDVDLLGAPSTVFTSFDSEFTSGLCDFPLIGDLIQLIIGDIEPIVTDGLVDVLSDPDGSGPMDAPIAEGIEVALADISIAGEIGMSLGLDLEAPLFDVTEDAAGLTLGADARITSATCVPPAGAPDLPASLAVAEPFPPFGATTPLSGLPYGLGICISTSAFNQLLKAEVECGLLATSLTEIDLGGGPVALTAGVLSLFIPELGGLDPATPFEVQLQPTLAPVLTGNPGPNGEPAELRLGGLVVKLRDTVNEVVWVDGQLDFRAGLDFAFDDTTGELVPSIGAVTADDLTVDIVGNAIMTDADQLAFVLQQLLPTILPSLGDSLGSFPLPQFLGLDLQAVAVEQNGEFVSLFVDLVQAP